MVSTHSIFSRQWWAVVLRRKPAKAGSTQAQVISAAEAIADVFNGSVHKSSKSTRRGVFVASLSETVDSGWDDRSVRSMLLLQTDRVYFPLVEDSLEIGALPNDGQTTRRDFPRRIISGETTLFQYPLLTALSSQSSIGDFYVLAAPYYLLLRELVRNLAEGRLFSDYVSIDVSKVFAELKKVKVKNGAMSMSAGRMVITGIEFLRSAVFFGDNVIASPLYTDLVKLPKVTVDPKDCRLHRSYEEPVGGNRRMHVCWFDQNGNFRFTPGADADATVHKFLELLDVLAKLRLIA